MKDESATIARAICNTFFSLAISLFFHVKENKPDEKRCETKVSHG